MVKEQLLECRRCSILLILGKQEIGVVPNSFLLQLEMKFFYSLLLLPSLVYGQNMVKGIDTLSNGSVVYSVTQGEDHSTIKYGVKDAKGNDLIPAFYAYIESFDETRFVVCKDGVYTKIQNKSEQKAVAMDLGVKLNKHDREIQCYSLEGDWGIVTITEEGLKEDFKHSYARILYTKNNKQLCVNKVESCVGYVFYFRLVNKDEEVTESYLNEYERGDCEDKILAELEI